MSKKKSQRKNSVAGSENDRPTQAQSKDNPAQMWIWLGVALVATAICYFPMLSHELTNWDDLYYVTLNKLLIGPDYAGIFREPVVSNYHPITILSLALNYQIGQLSPFSYLLTNYILHIINVALVFMLVLRLSQGQQLVAFISSLIFAIHPMHVESVAWVAERKDVLYTFFYLLSLLSYWRYITSENRNHYYIALVFLLLSLLSKPAAIVLPMVFVLFDYWRGRSVKANLIEKIPAFVLAGACAILTLKIQSVKAVAALDMIPLMVRPLFACYALMIYLVRFVVPYPLSTFHPYPPIDQLGWPILISPVFVIALAFVLWRFRSNKIVVFGIFFYVINLLLVLQIVSFGNTIVSERYTYVPYIGIAFMLGMLLIQRSKQLLYGTSALVLVGFGWMCMQQVQVWRDSGTLWDNVIKHYPLSAVPRSNRANYVAGLAAEPAYAAQAKNMNLQAFGDCDTAVMVDPKHAPGYRIRAVVALRLNRYAQAAKDADDLKVLMPEDPVGYTIGASANFKLGNGEKSLADYNQAVKMLPGDADVLNGRGTLLFNFFHRYQDAFKDFEQALSLRKDGSIYLNRSRCYYMFGDMAKARADVQTALSMRTSVDADYLKLVGL